jgi:hypothetical protein
MVKKLFHSIDCSCINISIYVQLHFDDTRCRRGRTNGQGTGEGYRDRKTEMAVEILLQAIHLLRTVMEMLTIVNDPCRFESIKKSLFLNKMRQPALIPVTRVASDRSRELLLKLQQQIHFANSETIQTRIANVS